MGRCGDQGAGVSCPQLRVGRACGGSREQGPNSSGRAERLSLFPGSAEHM